MKTAPLLLALACAAGVAHAQKVYKHVDEKGNVTYSQTPPANAATTVSVPPPRKLNPGLSRQHAEEMHAERMEYERRRIEFEERRLAEQREALLESQRKRTDALRAECQRNRGTDCDDPASLARMEAERGPTQYRPRAR